MLKTLSAENTDRKVQADVKKSGEISVRKKGATDCEEAAYKRAQESQKAHRRSAIEESAKTFDMEKYLARSCPRCNGYLGVVLREPGRNVPLQAVNGRCTRCSYRMAWIVIRGKGSSSDNIRKASHT